MTGFGHVIFSFGGKACMRGEGIQITFLLGVVGPCPSVGSCPSHPVVAKSNVVAH